MKITVATTFHLLARGEAGEYVVCNGVKPWNLGPTEAFTRTADKVTCPDCA